MLRALCLHIMEAPSDTVTLLIQNKSLKCCRADLVTHSDYFKAMLQGNFMESGQDIIPLTDIDYEAMNTIMKLLTTPELVIEDAHLLVVLQTASMLQFLTIRDLLMTRLHQITNVNNCLQIWLCLESLNLPYHNAKLLALLEFMSLKDVDVLELDFDHLFAYLANVNLQCTEFSVFETIFKWFRFHNLKCDVLVKLLHCVNFTAFTVEEVNKMIGKCAEYQQVVDALQCVLNPQTNNLIAKNFLKARSRNLQGFPCVLLDSNEDGGLTRVPSNSQIKYFSWTPFRNFEGSKIVGYKQYLYIYGGGWALGKGSWNYTVNVYNTISKKFESRKRLPFARRHFHNVVCGAILYVIGGTGTFRVMQNNMFWCDLQQDVWSELLPLPCSAVQIIACNYNNQLLILDCNNKCVYIYCDKAWKTLSIADPNNCLPIFSRTLSLCCYKSDLFIKNDLLFRLRIEQSGVVVVNEIALPKLDNWVQSETLLCGNVLYCLNKHQVCDDVTISLQLLNMDTYVISTEYLESDYKIQNKVFKFRQSLDLFGVFHDGCEINDLINTIP